MVRMVQMLNHNQPLSRCFDFLIKCFFSFMTNQYLSSLRANYPRPQAISFSTVEFWHWQPILWLRRNAQPILSRAIYLMPLREIDCNHLLWACRLDCSSHWNGGGGISAVRFSYLVIIVFGPNGTKWKTVKYSRSVVERFGFVFI